MVCESTNPKVLFKSHNFESVLFVLANSIHLPPHHIYLATPSITSCSKSPQYTWLHRNDNLNFQVPFFNAPIYLQNKTSIGKVDEILGPINQVYFTIKTTEGVQASSFQSGDKVYIASDKLLPLERFLPKPKPPPGTKGEQFLLYSLSLSFSSFLALGLLCDMMR